MDFNIYSSVSSITHFSVLCLMFVPLRGRFCVLITLAEWTTLCQSRAAASAAKCPLSDLSSRSPPLPKVCLWVPLLLCVSQWFSTMVCGT